MTLRPGERDLAESLAANALAFLAAEPERLERFLSLAGIDPGGIRAAAASPGFLVAVMEHLMSDEPLLLAFAANEGIRPERVVKAAHALGIVPWERGFA
ncbi:MAG: DUF3572 domain-containing protein [Phreatobacter sp.]|uniref:DUF3572 domain-containing protein n=1 Tax=Phreatobacter sp. TaxID=1966341 RepID=UPI001A3D2722|nr:DUF3572 domain-containing protein [Phreatobacter sp.]MBL8571611.1 DUF3572 domain-containing protein [Phreatobacter sp.]